jgi:hypothetical protein
VNRSLGVSAPHSPRLAATLLVLLLAAPAARAQDPVASLTTLARDAATSANPAMAFLQGLGGMGDFDLRTADIRRALTDAGVPATGMLRDLLGPTTRLRKRGANVEIDRSEETMLRLDSGSAIEIGRRVKARLRVEGANEAMIDKVDGIKVGESADSLYDLWRVQFTREGNKPVAKVTAGALVFSKTVTIDLSRRTPPPAHPTPPTPTASSRPGRTPGLTGAVETTTR